jgi:hypothetical protein
MNNVLKASIEEAYTMMATRSRHDNRLMDGVCHILDEGWNPIKWALGRYNDYDEIDEYDGDFREEVVVEYIKFAEELDSRGIDLYDVIELEDLDCDFFEKIAASMVMQFPD